MTEVFKQRQFWCDGRVAGVDRIDDLRGHHHWNRAVGFAVQAPEGQFGIGDVATEFRKVVTAGRAILKVVGEKAQRPRNRDGCRELIGIAVALRVAARQKILNAAAAETESGQVGSGGIGQVGDFDVIEHGLNDLWFPTGWAREAVGQDW